MIFINMIRDCAALNILREESSFKIPNSSDFEIHISFQYVQLQTKFDNIF